MKKKIIIIILSILFFIDLLLVIFNKTKVFDNFIYQIIINYKNSNITELMKVISFIASTKMVILYNIILCLIVFIKKKSKLLFITITSISSGVINNLVKFIIKRERPFGIALVNETFYSFPSGHAMISILFFGTIVYLLNEHKPKYYKVINTILLLFIILVGISRIYLGVHYASDIIGGYLLGSIILLLLSLAYKKYNEE